MRWKGILFLVILAAIIIGLSLIFTDRWLEGKLEDVGSSLAGAKVEIDRLDFSIVGLHLRWQRLQIADSKDTWKNLLETSKCELDLRFLPLLSGKVIVDNMQASGAQTGTKRATDGKIIQVEKAEMPEEPGFVGKTIQRLQGEIAQASVWNLDQYTRKVNVDSIIKLLDLRSPGKIDSLQFAMRRSYAHWDSLFSKAAFAEDIKSIEAQVKSIEPAQIKTLIELQAAFTKANNVRLKVDSLQKLVTTSKNGLQSDLKVAQNQVAQVDDWIKADFQQALEKAKLPDISSQSIGRMVFGKKVVDQVNGYLVIAAKTRYYASKLSSDKPKKEKPPRLKGQNIHFPQKDAQPKFWIKKIELSGQTPQQVQLSGLVTDIVSNQRMIGKTTDVALSGSRQDGAALSFNAVFDYRQQKPAERFVLNASGIPIADVKLSDSPLFPYRLAKGKGFVESTLELGEESLHAEIGFTAKDLNFDLTQSEASLNKLEKAIRSVVQSATTIDLLATIDCRGEQMQLSLNSNLDDLLATQLRSLLSAEVDAAQKKLQSYIDSQVQSRRDQVRKLVQQKQAYLEGEINKYAAELQDQLTAVQEKRKSIERRMEEEKTGQAKKMGEEAKKKLKKIF